MLVSSCGTDVAMGQSLLGKVRIERSIRQNAVGKVAWTPDVEEWKWAKATSPGVPVWSHDGIICTGESYKSVVKLTFAQGESLPDPTGLFNASLDGKVRRAIDMPEGGEVDAKAFKALIRAAVARNAAAASAKPKAKTAPKK